MYRHLVGLIVLGAGLSSPPLISAAFGQPAKSAALLPAEDADGVELVGSDPLQARSSYQLVPHERNGRWYLYVGHHPGKLLNSLTGIVEESGMSVLDVTDPSRPQYLHHEPPGDTSWVQGPAVTAGTYHVQVCDGSALPRGKKGKTYVLRTLGEVAHEILDATDPKRMRRVREVVRAQLSDLDQEYHTHKNFWDCSTGIAYMVTSVAGWHTENILQTFDLSDPEHPKHIRDFGLPGSEPGSIRPGAGGEKEIVRKIHSVIAAGDRLYLAYNPFDYGVVQILDRDKFLEGDPTAKEPFNPTPENLTYPQIGRLDFPGTWGVHTAQPVLGMKIPGYGKEKQGGTRDILISVSEGLAVNCHLARHIISFVDISEPAFPIPISTYQADADKGNFCERPGFFGPHNIQLQTAPMFNGKLLFVSYFAAGMRVIDMRNPFAPVEVGHYIPAVTANTHYLEAGREFLNTPLTNDVAVDSRGYIYISDRARTGLHILRLTGKPAEIAAGR